MSFSQASNNEAECEALLHGMKMTKACDATRLKIFGDSNLYSESDNPLYNNRAIEHE
jgi:ribonuclease HI